MTAAQLSDVLSSQELDAVATIWKRERRKLVTSFDGTSMLPAIAPGQQVTVECGIEPEVGDIAVFRFDRHVGVHRVVACTEAWVLTWGDANPLPDEPIERTRVIGVISDIPPAPRTLSREWLLRLLYSPGAQVDTVARRVRLAHRARAAWVQGPLVFAGKALRTVIFRRSRC